MFRPVDRVSSLLQLVLQPFEASLEHPADRPRIVGAADVMSPAALCSTRNTFRAAARAARGYGVAARRSGGTLIVEAGERREVDAGLLRRLADTCREVKLRALSS